MFLYQILTKYVPIPGVIDAFSLFLLSFFIAFIITELQLSRIVYFFMSPWKSKTISARSKCISLLIFAVSSYFNTNMTYKSCPHQIVVHWPCTQLVN